MSSTDTLNDLLGRKRLLLEQKKAIEKILDALTVVIDAMLNDTSDDTSAPRRHGRRNDLTDAIHRILSADGPLHRKVILERVEQAGFHIGGANPLTSLGAYLSTDARFASVSRGCWGLTDEPEQGIEIPVTPERASLPEPVEESRID